MVGEWKEAVLMSLLAYRFIQRDVWRLSRAARGEVLAWVWGIRRMYCLELVLVTHSCSGGRKEVGEGFVWKECVTASTFLR